MLPSSFPLPPWVGEGSGEGGKLVLKTKTARAFALAVALPPNSQARIRLPCLFESVSFLIAAGKSFEGESKLKERGR
jgi:hypothetical protein